MTREELDRRNAAALTRHYRTWTDNAGQAPRGLLDDLARIADRHAIEENAAAAGRVLAARLEAFEVPDGQIAEPPDTPGPTESHPAVTPSPPPAPGPGTRRTASTRAAASGSGRTRRTAK